jgi:hypothetical protein
MNIKKQKPVKTGGLSMREVDRKKLQNKSNSKKPTRQKSSHTTWVFQPRLANMGAVLHAMDSSVEPEVFNTWVQDFRAEIQKLIRANGFTEGARRINLVRDYTVQLIEGRKPENPPWLATSESYNVPSCLNEEFIKYIISYLKVVNGGTCTIHNPYQVIITILNIQKVYEGLVDSSYESITKKKIAIDEDFLGEFSIYVKDFLDNKKKSKNYPIFKPSEVNFEEYRFSVQKNGPNGLPKVESAHIEAVKLCGSSLFQPWKRLASYLEVNELINYVSVLAKTKVPEKRKEGTISIDSTNLRKLVSVPDKGFKTRIVAICDFWTQLLLEPVREHVQAVIQFLFIQDYRMDQNQGVTAMVEFQKDCISSKVIDGHTLDIQYLKFYDISAWTDRFHHDLQKVTMNHLFNAGISEVWAQLTVHCKWYVPELGSSISYAQGQGMGTNGSFDIATLTEHLLIHFMYSKEGPFELSQKIPYGKVGDDLWIYDPKGSYLRYCEKINLPINLQKSKEYCDLGSVAEFCSRTAINGKDVSRVSPNVINRSSDFRSIPQLLSVCNQRGVSLNPSSFPTLQRTLKGKEERYLDKLQPWLISAVVINKFTKNLGSPYGFLNADYLVQNDWVIEDSVKNLINDQESLTRIMIGNSIISIINSQDLIEKKISSLRSVKNASRSYDEIESVLDTDLFTTDQTTVEMVRQNLHFEYQSERVEIDNGWKLVLLPWEIIPIVRFKTLNKNLTVKLLEAHDIEGDKVEDILEFATLLNRIAVSVDFDGTNINYNSKRVYDRQFSIVKFFEKSEMPFTILRLDNERQLNLINSILSYEELPVEWVNSYLPTLIIREESDEEVI